MKLPSLYKQTKTGAIQQYDVGIAGDTYVISQGQVGGVKQHYSTQCEPKNVGKANETTGEDQALSEGTSRHAKKLKAGYTLDPSGTVTVRLPQKVQTYSKHKKKVIFPCYESPKLNGVNATYRWENNTLSLTSRGGEPFPLIEQHIDAVKQIMFDLQVKELNGEIYVHGVDLQYITGAVKKYRELTARLEFHIFDLPDMGNLNYEGRLVRLRRITETEFVKVVPVDWANSHECLDALHDNYFLLGYEGLIIRNKTGVYKYNERSNDVFKLKKALDAEFRTIAFKLDKLGHAVFTCFVKEDVTFDVKLKGTAEERLEMAGEAGQLLGKYLKVEYETLSAIGKPLKPVGIVFRKVGEDGEALE